MQTHVFQHHFLQKMHEQKVNQIRKWAIKAENAKPSSRLKKIEKALKEEEEDMLQDDEKDR